MSGGAERDLGNRERLKRRMKEAVEEGANRRMYAQVRGHLTEVEKVK